MNITTLSILFLTPPMLFLLYQGLVRLKRSSKEDAKGRDRHPFDEANKKSKIETTVDEMIEEVKRL